MRRGPPEEGVEAAAIAVRAGVGLPRPLHLAQVHHAVGLGRKDARARRSCVVRRPLHVRAASRISSASSRRRACRQSRRLSGSIAWPSRPHARRLAIGRRAHDQPVDRLLAPAAIHQLAGQPVEQLGMAGGRALGAEVVVGLDQAAAEIGLPDPVDRDPGRQRVAAIDQPAGQVQAIGRRARARILQAAARRRERPARRARPCG